MYKEISEELVSFIKKSPTAFHAIEQMSQILKANGYQELLENESWSIVPGGRYFITCLLYTSITFFEHSLDDIKFDYSIHFFINIFDLLF